MAPGGDAELIDPAGATADSIETTLPVEADDAEAVARIGEEDTQRRPLAGVAPGLHLAHEPGGSTIDPLAAGAAARRKPRNEIDALNTLALEKMDAGEHAAAVDALRRALNFNPDAPAAHGNLALGLWRNKSTPLAEIHARRAIALNANYIPAYRILAELLRQRNAPDAIGCYRRLIELDPDNYIGHNNIGLLLNKLGRRSEADAAFGRALELKPGNPHIRFNQLLVRPNGDLAEAIECCHRALAERPGDPDILTNLAIVLQFSGRYDEAMAEYERACAINPAHRGARFNMSLLLLLRGDYARGWSEYENRWELTDTDKPAFSQPEWQGEDIAGKTILLQSEQGFGDGIQCLRYVPDVLARGARVALRVERPLVRLAASLPGNLVITPMNAPPPAFDVWCPLLTLPRILGTRLDSIPAQVPYLAVRPGIAERWRQRLADLPGLKVGLAWAGSPSHINDFRRSIDLSALQPLFDVSGVSFVSLQVGPRTGDLAALPPDTILDLSRELIDFAETAGAMLSLDLVIAVDTAVVHLAGALARPAWAMLTFSPDWRWLLGRDDNPWYPTLRLYRQPTPGDWNSVIARVAADLATLASDRARGTAEA
jgi:tetratricopeptide (TPR) repeat protein